MEQTRFDLSGPQFDLLLRKFEPERLRVVLFLAVLVHRIDIEASRARERLSLISASPGGSFLANSYLSPWQALTPSVARTVFHLSGPTLVYRRTGSTDTTLDYVQEFCFLILALATTVLWSILDRKRKDYRHLHAWLRLLVRYTLSFTLFTYGLVKIFLLQFRPTTLDRFIEPYGHFPPIGRPVELPECLDPLHHPCGSLRDNSSGAPVVPPYHNSWGR